MANQDKMGAFMKNMLLATTAACVALTMGGAAGAADIPVKAPRPLPPPCAAAQFQGGYIGVSGGGVNWTANRTDQDEVLVDVNTIVQKRWGGIAGGQIGYNWTTCNTVWGIEVDGSWVGARVTTRLSPNSDDSDITITSRFDALVTARTRAGIVMDNLLLYVTGGVAAARFKTEWSNAPDGFATISEWRWGWTAGFGTEYAWTPNVSIKFETLYVDFVDREHRVLFFPPDGFGNFTHSDSAWITRIGINVKFGKAPVVARY
jgi:outer membrane immunogenic protein